MSENPPRRKRPARTGYDMMVLAFSARPIAFHPELSIALGGIYEALMFQQIAYWSDKGDLPDGWIYKTGAEFREETTMTRYQLDKARANLVRIGVIQAKLRGVPATMHYKVVWDRLYAVLQGEDDREVSESGAVTQFVEGEQTGLAKGDKLAAEGQQPSLLKVDKLDCSPSANPNRNRDYAETTQRQQPNDFDDQEPPAITHLDQFKAMTPEERLAQFETTKASLARLRGLS